MTALEKLRAKLAGIIASAQVIVDAADAATEGVMSEDQQTAFDNLITDSETVTRQIDAKVALEKMTNSAAAPAGRVSVPTSTAQPVASVIETPVDESWGFADIAEYATCVRRATSNLGIDDRLGGPQIQNAPANFMQETGGTEGYYVPPQMRNEIWDLVFNNLNLLSLIDLEPTMSNSVEFIRDQSTPWSTNGVVANWRAGGIKMDPSKLAEKTSTLSLHELYAFILATDELMEDAPRLASRLTTKAAEAITWKLIDAIVYGNGVAQPMGYMNSGALVSVAKEAGQAADSLVVENIAKMYSRLLPSGLSRAMWLMNSDIFPQLITMVIGDKPIYTPPVAGITLAPSGFLLGLPIQFSEHSKMLGDKGDIQLIDPKGYYGLSKNGGIRFDSSIHLYFDYGIQAFRWTFRFGGQPYLSAPITPNNGTNTKSHFVTLDERA